MVRLDFWYEFASTYSYPAAMRIDRLAAARGVEIRWRPFLLGPIFSEQGWMTSPFNLYPAKGRYMWRDLERICAEQGLSFVRPDPFPQDTLLAARIATALEGEARVRFSRAVFAAEFGQGCAIGDRALLGSILDELGLPAESLDRAGSETVKAALRASVEEARTLGIFGAPSFVSADGELFWGDDRLEAALGLGGREALGTVMALAPDEIERYARHIVLRDIGGPGQLKLKAARVLVIGAGGLGAPLVQYLAAAGVGTIGIADDDTVSLSNLQRQVLHGQADLGRPKVDSAAEAVADLNPHVHVEKHEMRVLPDNARALIAGYDIVADGSDNFATRYLISDACFQERRPLVTAAVGPFDASLTTLRPFERGAGGRPNPTYRCLFPEQPAPGTVPTCAEAGVLGALTGIVGSMMALEVIREIVGFGEGLVGRLLLFDARAMRFETLSYGWDEDNPLNGAATVAASTFTWPR